MGRNPRVGLHLDSNPRGGYVEKYRESIARIGFEPDGFPRSYSVALRVTPARWRVW